MIYGNGILNFRETLSNVVLNLFLSSVHSTPNYVTVTTCISLSFSVALESLCLSCRLKKFHLLIFEKS